MTDREPGPVDSDTPTHQALISPRLPGPLHVPTHLTGRSHLGPYRIVQVIGEGGMGLVLLGEDTSLSRLVALKVMKGDAASCPIARQRFLQEGRAAAAIQHEHIVTIYQVGEDQGIPYLAMQFLQGESLEDRLKAHRRLAIADALRLARETAEGLAAAHEVGLIHRDIKPANLWLERRPGGRERIKVLDFGLARQIETTGPKLTQTGVIIGTPSYMAPEQARGQPDRLDPRCDLFSLGCVLYRMATGTEPFRREDSMATLLAVALDEPERPSRLNPEVPAGLDRLIEALLSKAVDARPPSARAVIDALTALEMDLGTGPMQSARSFFGPAGIAPGPWEAEAPARSAEPDRPSLTDTPQGTSNRTERLLARLAARELEAEGIKVCPGCGGTVSMGWCVKCGFLTSQATAAPPSLPEVSLPPDLRWLWVLLGGIGAVVLLSAAGLQFKAGAPMRTWWYTGETVVGLTAVLLAHVQVFVLSLPERTRHRSYQYLDPFELWAFSVSLLPQTRQALCLGAWGLTALLCTALFVGFTANWSAPARRTAPATENVPLPPPVAFPTPPVVEEPPPLPPVVFPSPPGKSPADAIMGPPLPSTIGPRYTATCQIVGYALDRDGTTITGFILATPQGTDGWQYAGTVPLKPDQLPNELLTQARQPAFRRDLARLAQEKNPFGDVKFPGKIKWLRIDEGLRCEVDYEQSGTDRQLSEPRIKQYGPAPAP